jgi:hypothetical protein
MAMIDPKFGKAKVGDYLTLPSPLKVGTIEALLVDIETAEGSKEPLVHHYKMYLFGVDVGEAFAWNEPDGPLWEVE